MLSRRRVYEILEVGKTGDLTSKVCDFTIIALIIGSVVSVILETIPTLSDGVLHALHVFDYIAISVFTIEYVFRVGACVEDPRYKRAIVGRVKYMLSPMALIDLIAILPYLVPLFVAVDLRVIRAIRLLRLFRLFKLARYSHSLRMIIYITKSKRDYLAVVLCLECVLLLVVASVMYFMEHEAQPAVFGTIPQSMWWAVVTLTTVGYGDVVPVTVVGKISAGFLSIMGISLFAVPAGIMAAGFNEQMLIQRERKRKKRSKVNCPHCGEQFESSSLFYADGTNVETLHMLQRMKHDIDQLVTVTEHTVHRNTDERLQALAEFDEAQQFVGDDTMVDHEDDDFESDEP